jgi:hypothetical protein
MTLRRLLAGATAIAGLAALLVPFAASSGAARPTLTVIATNLNNPRKLFVGAGDVVYVVEAGTGGSNKCFGTGLNTICVGPTGSITRIAHGRQRRVVTGLVSWATPAAQRAQGAAAVLVRNGVYYVLLGDAVANKRGGNDLGPDGATAGHLISTRAGKAAPRLLANLAAFEAAHNPDRGAGPGTKLGNPSIDSNPYAFTAYRGGFALVDAAANDLLWVGPTGRISVLAVFPPQTEKLTKAEVQRMGAPPGLTSLDIQSVPSSVAVGPDGALYVGELTGRPFKPGAARVWRVVPGKKPTVYAAGFTNISDLAFVGKNLLVLEVAARGLWDPPWTGALIRLAPDRTRTVIASGGLVAPTGLAVGRGSIFISNYGFYPGSGPEPHGQVVSLPLSLAS